MKNLLLLLIALTLSPLTSRADCGGSSPARPALTWVVGIDRSGSTDKLRHELENGIEKTLSCNAQAGDQLVLFTFGVEQDGSGETVYRGHLEKSKLTSLLAWSRRPANRPAVNTQTYFDVVLDMLTERLQTIVGPVATIIASDGLSDRKPTKQDIELHRFGAALPLASQGSRSVSLWVMSALPLALFDSAQTQRATQVATSTAAAVIPADDLACLVVGRYDIQAQARLTPELLDPERLTGQLKISVKDHCTGIERDRGVYLRVSDHGQNLAEIRYNRAQLTYRIDVSLASPASLSVALNGREKAPVAVVVKTWAETYQQILTAITGGAAMLVLLSLFIWFHRRSAPRPVTVNGWVVDGGLRPGKPYPINSRWLGLPAGLDPVASIAWSPRCGEGFQLAVHGNNLAIGGVSQLHPASEKAIQLHYDQELSFDIDLGDVPRRVLLRLTNEPESESELDQGFDFPSFESFS